MRAKDPRDIANILENYFELDEDNIYGNHYDLYDEEVVPLENNQIAAIVIGREIAAILSNNPVLLERINSFLTTEIGKVAKSKFMIEMVQETGKSVEEVSNLLSCIKTGMQRGGK